MVAVLAVGLAIPTFAAGAQPRAFADYYSNSRKLTPVYVYEGSKYLNVAGSYAGNNFAVTTYKSTSDITQRWYLYVADDGITTMRPVDNKMRALYLDLSQSNGCYIRDITATNVDYMKVITPGSQFSRLRLRLPNGTETALALGGAINANTNYYKLYWSANGNMQWYYDVV